MKRTLGAIALALLLTSCGGDQQIDAVRTLRDSATAMAQLKTASATLKIVKGTITIQGFTLVSARTAVRLPRDSDTVYTVKQQGVTIGLEVVIAGDRVFLHVPFSTFQEVKGAEASAFPDMARLFDSTTGLPAVIPAGSNPRYIATDKIDGQSAYQITTRYSPEQVRSLLSKLDSTGPVAATLWVDTSNHLVRKAVLSGPFGDGGADASVEVNITGFNGAVAITSPSLPPPSSTPSP